MDPERDARVLTSLIQFEIDAIKAYELALERIGDDALRAELFRSKADLERHVLEGSEVLRAIGVEPPAYARDLRGYLMACVAAFRSSDGGEGALRAIASISEAVIARYDHALVEALPLELRAQLNNAQADARRHLEVIDGMIAQAAAAPQQHSPPGEPDLG
jgi:hypothetical protein